MDEAVKGGDRDLVVIDAQGVGIKLSIWAQVLLVLELAGLLVKSEQLGSHKLVYDTVWRWYRVA